jgi:hypothetical protein
MSISASVNLHPRRPLDNQKNAGGDMSIMCLVKSNIPRKFQSPKQHLIKGLNGETIARLPIPSPDWITSQEYRNLLSDDPSDSAFFSLNLSLYNQTTVSSDWDDTWFFITGRVHPYAVTWEIDADNDFDNNDIPQDYTIPALIIREQGYQP